jgi:hypothetical protein
VRFGSATQYCLLDIDAGSAYHPQRDAFATRRIAAALEPLGLVTPVSCTSSDSGGLHLYFPFQRSHASWELATGIATLLENSGFHLKPGQLEVFPNPKPYVVEGRPSLFNAHRLPMQTGSYLLDQEFQPVWGDRQQFLQQWQFAQQQNHLDTALLKQLLRQSRRKSYRVTGKADKFIHDLNAEIESGWTGTGQTNWILGRITMRSYIFHHVLCGGEPLSGQALIDDIIATARSLPGYQQWCRHQHEIEKKAAEWARCIENSAYFPYGMERGKFKAKAVEVEESLPEDPADKVSWNQQQSEQARDRIRGAIAALLENHQLPAGATARFQSLTGAGIGGATLYRHRDLWHPDYLWITPPDPPNSFTDEQRDCAEGASLVPSPTSFLSDSGSNPLSTADSSDRASSKTLSTGSNQPTSPVSTLLPSAQPVCFRPTTDASEVASEVSTAKLREALSEVAEQSEEFDRSPSPLLPPIYRSWHWQDLSDIFAAITVELRRLNWTPLDVRDRLFTRYSQPSLDRLEDWQVVDWLLWLQDTGG